MYTAGIPLGLLVDSRGPRPGVLLGAVFLGIGYFSMYRGRTYSLAEKMAVDFLAAYNGGPDSVSMPWLCIFMYLTGVGGCAAFAGSVKTCTLSTVSSDASRTLTVV